jgi:Cu(I)/Ag(I) efflux system membrane protein CusA/SilA
MIAALIRWSAQNLVLTLIATLAAFAAGAYAVSRLPLDAIPDLSDTQVIVYAEFPGQAPQVVEDQVTYPLASALLSVPRSRVVRGFSYFGVSFVYVIFEDGTDIYWARSRVLEYLNSAAARLPRGVAPTLGPDATGVGWVYQYVVEGAGRSLAELRSLQDWTVRYGLAKAEGVAEIASVGGFVRQYQVTVDPRALQSHGIALARVVQAVRQAGADVGGRTVELSETEFVVRGRGYIAGIGDLEAIALKSEKGTPVRLGQVARIELAPDERRGLAELNGEGEAVSGIAVQRFGQSALAVIGNVKRRLAELAPSLPAGVTIRPIYDRAALIVRAIETLTITLLEECLIVALVCLVFLFHARSALVAIAVLPVGLLVSVLAMDLVGIGSNIMSLGGLAIAIGAMVDAAIVMIENAHKHLERAAAQGAATPRGRLLIDAAVEVGPSLFFSLLIITVSFLPIFALEAQEGRLFKPLAWTKTFAMAAAALLSVTLVPALMVLLIRGRVLPEARNPVNRALLAAYRPLIGLVLRRKAATLALAAFASAATVAPALRLGTEFMPNLDEGTLFYMPVSLPGLSVTKAAELAQLQNKIIKSFPEVESVLAKAGRAATATDPAPLEMFETLVNLKPKSQWRPGLTLEALIDEMDRALRMPGVTNAFTMPIKARIDMLATGIRTPLGLKLFGRDLAEIERLAREIEAALRAVPGTRSAYSERIVGGYYLDIRPDRAALARYGIAVGELQDAITTALGGETVASVVEGRERYAIAVRYPRELRDSAEAIARNVLVSAPDGMMVPLGQVAELRRTRGPALVRTENGQLVAYVFVDIQGRDIGGYVAEAGRRIAAAVKLPEGYRVAWSGQFEYIERAAAKLALVVPATLLIIVLLLYLNFRRLTETLLVLLSLPFALAGGVWLVALLGYNLSVAVAVGFIALAGVAAQTGVVMLLYLDHALAAARTRAEAEGRVLRRDELRAAIMAGAVERLRPKTMTVAAIMAGLLPLMWNTGTGSEVMQRIAAPMLGGMLSSTALTLVVIPALYAAVKAWQLRRAGALA